MLGVGFSPLAGAQVEVACDVGPVPCCPVVCAGDVAVYANVQWEEETAVGPEASDCVRVAMSSTTLWGWSRIDAPDLDSGSWQVEIPVVPQMGDGREAPTVEGFLTLHVGVSADACQRVLGVTP